MKSNLLKGLLASACMFIAVQAQALPLLLTPSTSGVQSATITPPNNCEPDCVETAFALSFDLTTLLYKADVGSTDSGVYAGSYETSFFNSPTDPADALIKWVSGTTSITCPECYLAIKDGKQDPNYYFFNLAGWNGTDDIKLEGFWPDRGAISHVAIWGTGGGKVPEPGSLALLGLALVGLGVMRRRV